MTIRDAMLLAMLALLACSAKPKESDEALMSTGLNALYVRHDPETAANAFRQVLAQNPSHYGATYQLAAALDAAGKPAEARPVWQKMLSLAQATGDAATAKSVGERLANADTMDEMRAGLDAMYTRHDPAAATVEFRKVLERNPTHYGATYQLAASLEAAGKRDEARPLWSRVLEMAEGYHDTATADVARARLAAGR